MGPKLGGVKDIMGGETGGLSDLTGTATWLREGANLVGGRQSGRALLLRKHISRAGTFSLRPLLCAMASMAAEGWAYLTALLHFLHILAYFMALHVRFAGNINVTVHTAVALRHRSPAAGGETGGFKDIMGGEGGQGLKGITGNCIPHRILA